MSAAVPDSLQEMFDEAEQAHFASLTPEDLMEGWNSAHQREITVESFAVVRRRQRLERRLLTFNEMVVLYLKGEAVSKVVPDNMVVLTDRDYEGTGSFRWDLEPDKPMLVIEYVSPGSERKDYDDNFRRYEQDLKVPYYLIFSREAQELNLFRLGASGYATVLPDAQARCAIPELEMHVGLVDGWVRYWCRDEMVPLPGELDEELEEAREAREETARQRDEERHHRADAERQWADAERQRADAERRQQDAERRQQDAERQRADAEQRQQDAERQRDEERRVREELEAARDAMAAELARLRAQLGASS